MAATWKRLWRRLRYGGREVIVVSGLPRSGTSMMMQMLDRGDWPILTDKEREADEDNPKGYYEFEAVKELHETQNKSWLEEANGKVVKVISFLLKDLPETSNYKVIFMEREVDEVIASQNKMLERRGETNPVDDEKMKQNYATHLRKVRYLLEHDPRFEVLFINHRDCVADPLTQAERVNRFLGNKSDAAKMASAVDESLYRNRAG